jgi:hypothetical protein
VCFVCESETFSKVPFHSASGTDNETDIDRPAVAMRIGEVAESKLDARPFELRLLDAQQDALAARALVAVVDTRVRIENLCGLLWKLHRAATDCTLPKEKPPVALQLQTFQKCRSLGCFSVLSDDAVPADLLPALSALWSSCSRYIHRVDVQWLEAGRVPKQTLREPLPKSVCPDNRNRDIAMGKLSEVTSTLEAVLKSHQS